MLLFGENTVLVGWLVFLLFCFGLFFGAVFKMYLIKCPLVIPTISTVLSTQHASARMLKAKEERGEKREKDAIFFEVSRPAVYLINLYEIFLPKN